jgi:site-specific recombinase XerC
MDPQPIVQTQTHISPPTLGQALETFLASGEMAAKSPATLTWYRDMLSPLFRILGTDIPVIQIMEADLEQWYARTAVLQRRYEGDPVPQPDESLSPYTFHDYVRAVRRFFKWIHSRGLIEVNLAERLALPRLPDTPRKGIADEDLERMLAAARIDPRDYSIFKFAETSGSRLGGIAHLLITDLSLSAREPLCRRVLVREKGMQGRPVFITPETLDAIHAWLEIRPAIKDSHVFLGRHIGRPWKPLTEKGIFEIFRRRADEAGVTHSWSPHQWRHRLARKLLEARVPLSVVSQILGHKSEAITARFYGKLPVDHLQDCYDLAFQTI